MISMELNDSKPKDTISTSDINILWNFLSIIEKPSASDAIFVFGGVSSSIPEKTAQLYKEGVAKVILVTGGTGGRTHLYFKETEALKIRESLIKSGVPDSAIISEQLASNTGENVSFGMKRLLEHTKNPSALTLVSAPFSMRRCVATFNKQFPEISVTPCPPQISASDYSDREPNEFALRLVGEIERLKNYAELGYITKTNIPEEVELATQRISNSLR